MSALIRHLSTSLLCVLMTLGHLPAWYHVVTCDHSSRCGTVEQAKTTAPDCECVFHRRAERLKATSVAVQCVGGDCSHEHPGGHHDPDTCSICQTLAAPCGFNEAVASRLPSEMVFDAVCVASESIDVPSNLLLPPLRGPPVSVA